MLNSKNFACNFKKVLYIVTWSIQYHVTIVKYIYILGWLNCSQLEMEGRKVDGDYTSRKKGKLLQSSQGGFDTPWNSLR